MTKLVLRDYQQRSLEALEAYLRLASQQGAKMAFLHETERPYRSVPALPELPYVCLRVPTGGGKTLMACHALGMAARELLQTEQTVCLWLVPSNAIRDQTETLTVIGELDEAGMMELQECFTTPEARQAVDQMQKQLRLLGMEPGWDVPGLVNWLDRQIRHPDITRTESSLFLHNCISGLMESRGVSVEQLAQQKFRLKNALAEKIDRHRRAQAKQSFQQVLFENRAGELEVSPMFCFHFREGQYAPNWYYEGSYQWNKHFFPVVGELKSDGEEFDCAVLLDQHPKVSYWVRNLERRPESAFWLQTSSDKFYPDFVAMLFDGRILIVEYKGEHLWSNDDSKEKRAIGELWADRSNGRCLFVMPKGPDWGAIQAAIE